MKNWFVSIVVLTLCWQSSLAQNNTDEKVITDLSLSKWKWMADKDVDKLSTLFHDQSKFVHMSGTWKKKQELEVIKSGSIWYKKADVHDVAVEILGDMAIVWSRITLTAVVRGADAINQFTVTEAYKKESGQWKLIVLTFSSVRDTHKIEH